MMKLNFRSIYLFVCLLVTITAHAIDTEREFEMLNASNDLADNSAQVVVCTKTGRMIISTLGNLNFYDGTSFTHIDNRQEYKYQLPLYRGNYHLYFDRYHHIWLKNTNSVTCVDLLQEQFVENVEDVVRNGFGCEKDVLDLFVDSIGDVWFLTEDGLYDAKNKRSYQMQRDRNLQDIDVIGDVLYAFYDNGEEVALSRKTGGVLHRTKAYAMEEAQRYLASSVILRYSDGFFQIRNGEKESILLFFDAKKLTWTTILKMDSHLNNLALYNDCLYVSSEYGYWVYNVLTGEKQHVRSFKLIGSDKFLDTSCNMIAFDRQGGMWIGTELRGLLYARPALSPFKIYDWDNPLALKYASHTDHVEGYVGEYMGIPTNCKFVDSRGWTWFGTTMGLYMHRSPQSEPKVYTRKDGLFNNVIHSIVEDKKHNIWVATSCGISCILFENNEPVFVNSFNHLDNVPNESFINSKAVCMEDGTIVMQAVDHVIVFNPGDFKLVNSRKLFRLYPKLIRLLVNGNYIKPGESVDGNIIMDRAITRMKDISLNADQNSLSLTFSALNYFRPLQTYYRVKVKGLDNEWRYYSYYDGDGMVDKQGMLHLSLISLKPGNYEVAVQASLFPDIWPDDEPYAWIVHVNQPWWQATGVYLLLGAVIFILLIVNLFFYGKNTRMRARLNTEEGDIIRKVRSFVDRCDAFMNTPFAPSPDDIYDASGSNQLSPEFLELMVKVLPYVRNHHNSLITMRKLSNVGDIDVADLYTVLTSHLYKNPRGLARHILLQKGAELLRTTDKTVEEIADECGYATPNFFMGNFFHEFKMTPREYREENR